MLLGRLLMDLLGKILDNIPEKSRKLLLELRIAPENVKVALVIIV
jgi:hypothetical protein